VTVEGPTRPDPTALLTAHVQPVDISSAISTSDHHSMGDNGHVRPAGRRPNATPTAMDWWQEQSNQPGRLLLEMD